MPKTELFTCKRPQPSALFVTRIEYRKIKVKQDSGSREPDTYPEPRTEVICPLFYNTELRSRIAKKCRFSL